MTRKRSKRGRCVECGFECVLNKDGKPRDHSPIAKTARKGRRGECVGVYHVAITAPSSVPMSRLKVVTKAEFYAYLDAHPGLTPNISGICEPPMEGHYDFVNHKSSGDPGCLKAAITRFDMCYTPGAPGAYGKLFPNVYRIEDEDAPVVRMDDERVTR